MPENYTPAAAATGTWTEEEIRHQPRAWIRSLTNIDALRSALNNFLGHCCKVSDEAAFCLIQRPYISKTLLTRRISPRGSP